ncbi:hypothetical protein B0H19DRAFT_1062314 [Mycena capillaripes]|nr:hypothetical protein B0H19DRAFT_1062314 [Mycena capillaripes]
MASTSPPDPCSPFPSSSGRSSTLVMTPAPLSLSLLPSFHRGPKAKGHLQPHITNLPRRPKRAPVRITAPRQPSTSSSSPSSTSDGKKEKEDVDAAAEAQDKPEAEESPAPAPSPICLPALPPLPFPISAPWPAHAQPSSTASQEDEEESIIRMRVRPEPQHANVPVGPAHANVPRRRRAKKPPGRCLQELGRASGVFVAFAAEGDAQAQAQATEAQLEEGFGAVVCICEDASIETEGVPIDDTSMRIDDDGERPVLRLGARGYARDDGVPRLRPAQLRAARAFVRAYQETDKGAGRVLITAPRARAADALAVGVCCACVHPPMHVREGGVAGKAGDRVEEGEEEDEEEQEEAERIHRLLVRWHDLPADEWREEDEERGGGGWLREEWRGLLSRDGIEYVAGALVVSVAPPSPAPSSARPSTSTPPSSPSPLPPS